MPIARGTFTVTLQPLEEPASADGVALGRMSIDKVISGDLEATTKGQMLSAMTATRGSAGYVALERVTGTLGGRSGSFVLQHSGSMNRGAQTLSITVVPDSGTGELAGIEGVFTLVVEAGEHRYSFEYSVIGAG